DATIDHRLSGHVLHELCHGLQREADGAPPPWMVIEAAALHLGFAARREHIFPREPGEAIPGVSLFVLVGEALARRHGAAALWRAPLGAPAAELFGPRVAAALDAAGWQDWLARRCPPFVNDALRALSWIKLAEAAAAPAPDGDAVRRPLDVAL